MLFDDANMFERFGDDHPDAETSIDFFIVDYLEEQRRAWPEHRESALRAAMQEVARRIARMVDRGERLPQTIEQVVGRYRLVATLQVEDAAVIAKVYAFGGTAGPWAAGLSDNAVRHDGSTRRARFVVRWHSGGFSVETRACASPRLLPVPEASPVVPSLRVGGLLAAGGGCLLPALVPPEPSGIAADAVPADEHHDCPGDGCAVCGER